MHEAALDFGFWPAVFDRGCGSLAAVDDDNERGWDAFEEALVVMDGFVFAPVPGESVSSYLCVGLFLQVFVEAVGVGHSHLVDGLFPAGNPGSFDESASGSGGSFAFLGPPSSSFIFNIADHQPQRLQR